MNALIHRSGGASLQLYTLGTKSANPNVVLNTQHGADDIDTFLDRAAVQRVATWLAEWLRETAPRVEPRSAQRARWEERGEHPEEHCEERDDGEE